MTNLREITNEMNYNILIISNNLEILINPLFKNDTKILIIINPIIIISIYKRSNMNMIETLTKRKLNKIHQLKWN